MIAFLASLINKMDFSLHYAFRNVENPVHEEKDGWWFWNETWSHRYGPYRSKKEAIFQLKEYCRLYL